MTRRRKAVELNAIFRALILGAGLLLASSGLCLAQEADAADEAAVPAQQETIETQFADYLHLAMMGRFDAADSIAQALLADPELDPLSDSGAERLVALSKKHENAMDILLLLVDNGEIGENANRLLDLIRASHLREQRKPAHILENIERLAGTPNQYAFAMEQLQASGEYAVPWMLKVLRDESRSRLHPHVISAMPKLGKNAVNPLIAALGIKNEVVRFFVMRTLGKIGYPQSLPFLKRIATDKNESEGARKAAIEAIEAIVVGNPGVKELPADELFARQAEEYYYNVESLRADARQSDANLWYLNTTDQPRDEPIVPVIVSHELYPLIQCMQTCEASLALDVDQPTVLALWMAANFRREAVLGLDVESEAPADELDPTRPENFPRSVYFARSFGPRHARIVLNRAVHDQDRDVALGAIAALSVSAGPDAMVEPSGEHCMSLAQALYFPDLLVRIKAALALGRAMSATDFQGADQVVPVLASALTLQGHKFYMIVEPNQSKAEALAELMSNESTTVVAETLLSESLRASHEKLTHLDAIFLASDMQRPTVIEAIRQIKDDPAFGLSPIVVNVKNSDNIVIDRIRAEDDRVGIVLEVGDKPDAAFIEAMLARSDQAAPRFGYRAIDPELELELALTAANVLKDMLISGTKVFDASRAEQALADALYHPADPLRIASLLVLSHLISDTAQQAIARVALDTSEPEPLRLVAFDALADSARWHGMRLEPAQSSDLTEQATKEANLVIRTAASQALGAMNIATPQAAKILLDQTAK